MGTPHGVARLLFVSGFSINDLVPHTDYLCYVLFTVVSPYHIATPGNDRAGAVVVHVNGPRDDNHLSAAKQPRAAPLQAAGTVEKSAESTALRAFLGRNGQSGLVAETVAGNVEKGRRNLESISGTIHTLTRLREGECTVKDCRVLITGCGRSGTHYLSRELMRAGMQHRWLLCIPSCQPIKIECSERFRKGNTVVSLTTKERYVADTVMETRPRGILCKGSVLCILVVACRLPLPSRGEGT